MRNRTVPTKNIAQLSTASKALTGRAQGSPGIGVIEGDAGLGKSTAVAWLSNQAPSIYVRAIALWTPSAMLSDICRELRVIPGGSCATQVGRIVEAMSLGGQTLYLDEADYIVRQTRLVETLRDLHDLTTRPVVLIGESGIVGRLSGLKRFTSRIAQQVIFRPLDAEDTALIARDCCQVEIQPDLLAKIHADTRGNTRLIVVSLARVEQMARARGLSSIGAADVGRAELFSGGASHSGPALQVVR